MQYAVDVNGKKVKPTLSGEMAFCPFCREKVIGKCGNIYVWHWQHVHDGNCDSWKEAETPWHRAWKNRFPKDWQEKIIERADGKHIADIFTSDGIVIEFQNSSISSSMIAERERFYGKMIWVVNAQSFKDNLVTENPSEKLLAELANRNAIQQRILKRRYSPELENIKKNQKLVAFEIQSRKIELKELISLNNILKNYGTNPDEFAGNIVTIWQYGNIQIQPKLTEITNDHSVRTKKPFYRLLGDLKRNKHFLDLAVKNGVETQELDAERKGILDEIEFLKPALIQELKAISLKYSYLEGEIQQLQRIISFLKKDNRNDEEFQALKSSIDNYISAKLKELEAKFDQERDRIIKKNDKLNLLWKHKRKSWASAATSIFFDIGDEKMLCKYPDNKASILKVSDFLSEYNCREVYPDKI